MLSKKSMLFSALLCLCCSLVVVAEQSKTTQANLTAAQIVQKNVAARGGLEGWRAVQSMSWSGKLDAGGGSLERSRRVAEGRGHRGPTEVANNNDAAAKGEANKQPQLPFVLEMKRPGKSRVEIQFAGKTAVQVYDGKEGWMKRPFLNRDDWEPFSAEQAKSQSGKWDLDSPLLDYSAKGTNVEVESTEPIDGHDAYKLRLTMKDGTVQHIWIDAHSFLDVKVEGTPRRMDGKMRTVWVYQRDFRPVQGLMMPFLLETAVDGYRDTHKMVIEKIGLNPDLADSLFVRPKS